MSAVVCSLSLPTWTTALFFVRWNLSKMGYNILRFKTWNPIYIPFLSHFLFIVLWSLDFQSADLSIVWKKQKHNHKGHKKCLQTFWSKFPQDHDHLLNVIRFASNTVLAFIGDTSLPHQDLNSFFSLISDMYVVHFTNVNKHKCTNTGTYTCTNINIQTCTNRRKIGGQCSLWLPGVFWNEPANPFHLGTLSFIKSTIILLLLLLLVVVLLVLLVLLLLVQDQYEDIDQDQSEGWDRPRWRKRPRPRPTSRPT